MQKKNSVIKNYILSPDKYFLDENNLKKSVKYKTKKKNIYLSIVLYDNIYL